MSLKMKMAGSLLAVLVFVAMSDSQAGTVNTKQSVGEFVAQQQEIRKEVQTEARGWDAIPQSKRTELLAKQDRLFALLEGKQTLGDLNEMEQREVADKAEWIRQLANNAEEERQICRLERPTGSRRAVTVCRTVADINKERERVKSGFRQGTQSTRTLPSTGERL